jgi:hypothetical protein
MRSRTRNRSAVSRNCVSVGITVSCRWPVEFGLNATPSGGAYKLLYRPGHRSSVTADRSSLSEPVLLAMRKYPDASAELRPACAARARHRRCKGPDLIAAPGMAILRRRRSRATVQTLSRWRQQAQSQRMRAPAQIAEGCAGETASSLLQSAGLAMNDPSGSKALPVRNPAVA